MNWHKITDYRNNQLHYHEFKYHDHERDHRTDSTFYPYKNSFAGYILKRVWADKKFRIYLILLIVMIKAIAVLIVILSLPAILELIDSIKETGLKNLLLPIIEFMERIWNGPSNVISLS
jgi:hypothetical protein